MNSRDTPLSNRVQYKAHRSVVSVHHPVSRGRIGFDVGIETQGACRGVEYLVNPTTKLIVANDDNYALAA